MVTAWSCFRTTPESYTQEELSVILPHILISTWSQGQVQENMKPASADGIQEPYLLTLYLTTSEHFNLYNKVIVGLP